MVRPASVAASKMQPGVRDSLRTRSPPRSVSLKRRLVSGLGWRARIRLAPDSPLRCDLPRALAAPVACPQRL